jgi:hypothetical protein
MKNNVYGIYSIRRTEENQSRILGLKEQAIPVEGARFWIRGLGTDTGRMIGYESKEQ